MRELVRKIGAFQGALPMSWSRVNLLLTCPRQFDLRYRQKIKDKFIPEDPSAAEAGTLMHKTLQYAMERCETFGEYSYATSGYEYLFSRMLLQAAHPGTRERMLSLREPAAQVLGKLIGMVTKFNAKTSVEQRLALDRNWEPIESRNWDSMAWVGFVDLTMLAGDKCIIVDYKSEPWSEERSEKTELQTMLYAYATMRRMQQVQSVQTVTAFLQDEQIVASGKYLRSDMPELEERLRDLFTRYLRVLESGDVAPRSSNLCQWCAFAKDCSNGPFKEDTWQQEKDLEGRT